MGGWSSGCVGDGREDISYPQEIIVLYRSVKLIRGHTKTTEALLQTIALAIHWVVRGG